MRQLLNWRPIVITGMICVLFSCVNAACAREETPRDVELRIERVALFKNGLGFITSGATLPENITITFLNTPN